MAWRYEGLPDCKYGNKERDRKIEKRKVETEPTKFYHASVKKFKHGDVLEAEGEESLYMSDKPLPHLTIASERIIPDPNIREAYLEDEEWNTDYDGKWYVYEVEPMGEIEYGVENYDLMVKKFKILRRVGEGRAMLENQRRVAIARGKKEDFTPVGSKVYGTDNVREGKNKVRGHGRRYRWDFEILHDPKVKGDEVK